MKQYSNKCGKIENFCQISKLVFVENDEWVKYLHGFSGSWLQFPKMIYFRENSCFKCIQGVAFCQIQVVIIKFL